MKCIRCTLLTALVCVIATASVGHADVPQTINYQGRLTDPAGDPVSDGVYPMKFKFYGSESGDDSLWSSGFQAVQVNDGLFSYILGSHVPIPADIFGPGSEPFLGIRVGADPEISPRTPFISVAFSFHSEFSDSAGSIADGGIDLSDLGDYGASVGQVIKWNGSVWTVADDETGSGGTSSWTSIDSVLYTNNYVGIAKGGADNLLYGDSAHTHVNLGIACTTGVDGQNVLYGTIGGGINNISSGSQSTIGGGSGNSSTNQSTTVGGGYINSASGSRSTVSGGYGNVASGIGSTVGGGQADSASGIYSTVSGGLNNAASGYASTVSGGYYNSAAGDYSFASGFYAIANHRGSYVWADNTSGFASTAENQYLIRADGGVGINTNAPTEALEVDGTIYSTSGGFKFPDGTTQSTAATGGNWMVSDSVLFTNSYWGIARGGVNNALYGDSSHTHVNLGVACTTGASGYNYNDITISGGKGNVASGYGAVIGGGYYHTASGHSSVIAGGWDNEASGIESTVSGGRWNSASGNYSIVPGGVYNNANGDLSFAAGRRAKANHFGAFVWGDATDADFTSTATNQFLIRANGGVGINTNSPAVPLHVTGGSDVSTSGGGYITVDNGSGRKITIDDNEIMAIYNDSAGALNLNTGSGDVYICHDGGGDVGIGTNSPTEKLHVVGNICYTGTSGTCSDRRYKTNIRPFNDALSMISRINAVEFDWKKDEFPEHKFSDERQIGFIAQEINEILPHVVSQGNDGYYTVDYGKLTPVLLQAIKELREENESKDAKIDNLQRQVADLTNMVEVILANLNENQDDSAQRSER